MFRLQPCSVFEHDIICFFIRPRPPLIHKERVIRRTLGRCMLLETVESIDMITSFSQGELGVRSRERSDQFQIVGELGLRIEPSQARQHGWPRNSEGY